MSNSSCGSLWSDSESDIVFFGTDSGPATHKFLLQPREHDSCMIESAAMLNDALDSPVADLYLIDTS